MQLGHLRSEKQNWIQCNRRSKLNDYIVVGRGDAEASSVRVREEILAWREFELVWKSTVCCGENCERDACFITAVNRRLTQWKSYLTKCFFFQVIPIMVRNPIILSIMPPVPKWTCQCINIIRDEDLQIDFGSNLEIQPIAAKHHVAAWRTHHIVLISIYNYNFILASCHAQRIGASQISSHLNIHHTKSLL